MRDVSNIDTPIMVRAKITQDEWRQFRRLVFERDTDAQTLIGGLIRRELEGAAVQPAKDDAAAPSGG